MIQYIISNIILKFGLPDGKKFDIAEKPHYKVTIR